MEALAEEMSVPQLKRRVAFYRLVESAENPEVTEWDTPEMMEAKLQAAAARRVGG